MKDVIKTCNVIDIDSILYSVHNRGAIVYEIEDGIYIQAFDVNKVLEAFNEILENNSADKLVLVGKNITEDCYNFRYSINPKI